MLLPQGIQESISFCKYFGNYDLGRDIFVNFQTYDSKYFYDIGTQIFEEMLQTNQLSLFKTKHGMINTTLKKSHYITRGFVLVALTHFLNKVRLKLLQIYGKSTKKILVFFILILLWSKCAIFSYND